MSHASVLSQKPKPKVDRPKATYHPNIWGDRFLNNNVTRDLGINEVEKHKVEELKEIVRNEVFGKTICDDPSNQLNFIDSIQRLGLSYHFEKEIEEALGQIHASYNGYPDEDLHNASLRFRLLRQHGYSISCDLFEKFKEGDEGNFKECLVENIPDILSFYEASHLRFHGEEILEEALVFTTTHLESFVNDQKDNPLCVEITNALKRPLRMTLERLQARHYISVYKDQDSHNKSLLELAKLDFNLLQSLHQSELGEINRWWKELDISTKLTYARDRVMEIYVYWALGVYFEPNQSLGRSILTKVIMLTSVVDDTYDAYGKFHELELFTKAIQRWDIDCVDQLPEYMQLLYRAILKTFMEFEEEMEEGQKYRVHYAKEGLKSVVQAYQEEARWLHEGYVPTLEEYLDVTLVSSCYYMLNTVSIMGMKDNNNYITKDVFEWILEDPKIVRASTIICRLMDDIVSHKFEQKRHHIPSAVECYKNQYGVTEKEAYDELNKRVEDAWKDTNQDFLRPSKVPMPLLLVVLNYSRVIDLVYKDSDEYTHVGEVGKQVFGDLVIEPIP